MGSNEWKTVTLGEVANVQTGPFGSQLHQEDYVSVGTPIITVEHLGENHLIHDDLPRVTDADKQRLSKYTLKEGDIVFSRVGSVDRRALVKKEEEGWLFSGRCLRVRPTSDELNSRFLSYYFGLDNFKKYIRAIAVGSTMPSLNTTILSEIEIPFPPFATQRRIADILSALDEKIELNRQTNATLEAIAKSAFKEWFIDNENAKDWKESSLEDVFGKKSDCVLTGPFGSHLHAHDYRDEGTPLILVKHVMDGHILEDGLPLVGEHKLPEMQRYTLDVGDIVFTRVGAVGRSAYVYPRNKGWLISGQTLRVRVPDKSKLNPRFLAQIYLEESFVSMVNQHAVGTTRPSLNTSILLSFKFLLPPIELQNKFSDFVGAIDEQVQHNLDENRTLETLRDTLLPKLMSGELQVSNN